METNELCVNCLSKPVFIVKRQLCRACYIKLRKEKKIKTTPERLSNEILDQIKGARSKKEILFIQNFLKHNEWVYEPATFRFNDGGRYTPDFYDKKRNIFIEVVGSTQAFYQNRDKYSKFVKEYPEINIEFRVFDGTEIDTEKNGMTLKGTNAHKTVRR